MNTTVWHGVTIQELPIRYEQGLKGGTQTRTWRGQKAEIDNLFNLRTTTTRDTCEVTNVSTEGSPLWQLTSTSAYEINPPESRFELVIEKSTKDILNSDIPVVQSISKNNKGALLTYLQHPEKYFDSTPQFSTGSLADFTATVQVYKSLAAGHKQVLVFVPVLRMNYQTIDTSTFSNDIALTGKIRDTNKLISALNIPSGISSLLPASGDYTAISGVTLDPALPPLYYGWMQHPPTIVQTAMPFTSLQTWNWITVSQEWHFGLWDTYLYTVVHT